MLTPVDFREGLYWKRDDLYKPFGDYHVNGGKVRQALQLFETKIDDIKNEHNNGVITAASVHSPQSANIGKVAQKYGVACIAAVGGTKVRVPNINKIKKLGFKSKFYLDKGLRKILGL